MTVNHFFCPHAHAHKEIQPNSSQLVTIKVISGWILLSAGLVSSWFVALHLILQTFSTRWSVSLQLVVICFTLVISKFGPRSELLLILPFKTCSFVVSIHTRLFCTGYWKLAFQCAQYFHRLWTQTWCHSWWSCWRLGWNVRTILQPPRRRLWRHWKPWWTVWNMGNRSVWSIQTNNGVTRPQCKGV